MFHCPGMDLAGTRDILFHSGTAPGNPEHLVTLVYIHVYAELTHIIFDMDASLNKRIRLKSISCLKEDVSKIYRVWRTTSA